MENRIDERYLNFPVQLLAGFMTEKDKVLENIFHFALFTYSLKLEGYDSQRKKATINFFNVTNFNPTKGKAISETVPGKGPVSGISLNVFWDYYNQEKTPFECAVFLAYCALKSIVGEQSFVKIDNLYLLSRMDGKAKPVKDYSLLSKEVFEYATPYKIRKLKFALIESWGLKTYGRHTRGFYVSFKMELDALIVQAEIRRKKAKEAYIKKKEQEAYLKAIEKIRKMGY
jgi:hypothetical protein